MARKIIDRRKPIVELDKPYGKVKIFWTSTKEASEFYGFHTPCGISNNVTGRAKHYKNQYFRYATPKEIEIYSNIISNIKQQDNVYVPPPEPAFVAPDIPTEIIPETVQVIRNESTGLTRFEQLLQDCKNKFNEK